MRTSSVNIVNRQCVFTPMDKTAESPTSRKFHSWLRFDGHPPILMKSRCRCEVVSEHPQQSRTISILPNVNGTNAEFGSLPGQFSHLPEPHATPTFQLPLLRNRNYRRGRGTWRFGARHQVKGRSFSNDLIFKLPQTKKFSFQTFLLNGKFVGVQRAIMAQASRSPSWCATTSDNHR